MQTIEPYLKLYRYFESPPKYQILHSLVNRVEGGTSVFVDAIQRAQVLREKDRESFVTLSTIPVHFHYQNDGHFLHHAHTTIEIAEPGLEQSIRCINYSPPFQAPLRPSKSDVLYPALKAFAKLLDDPAARFDYTMQEGDAVLFDNRRVLHARTAFQSKESDDRPLETNRWLKGCYLEADAVYDRARILNL